MASYIDGTTFEISQITEDCEDLFEGYTTRISKLSPEEAEIVYAQRKAQIQSLMKGKGRIRTSSNLISQSNSSNTNMYHNITESFTSTNSQRITSHKRFITQSDTFDEIPSQYKESTPQSFSKLTPHRISRESARSNSPRHVPLQFEKVARHDVTSLSNKSQKRHLKKRNQAKSDIISKSAYDIYKPIYDRTTQWKEGKLEEIQSQKKTKETEELKECTFVPKINCNSSGVVYSVNLDLYERGMLAKETLKNKTEEILEKRKERELDNCTFKPRTNATLDEKIELEAIYDRQMEWRKQIQDKMNNMKLEQLPKQPKKTKPVKVLKQESTFSMVSSNEIKQVAGDREEFEMRYKRLSSMIDNLNCKIEDSLR